MLWYIWNVIISQLQTPRSSNVKYKTDAYTQMWIGNIQNTNVVPVLQNIQQRDTGIGSHGDFRGSKL